MIVVNLLRILVDLGFYYSIAGFVAAAFGGSGALAAAVLQAACYALSSVFTKNRALQLLSLLPMALGWILCRHTADAILILPAALYVIMLVKNRDYSQNQSRQQRLFSVYWKVLLASIPIALLIGGSRFLTSVTLPYGILTLTCSVLLMRSLRHNPQVYCQRSYQLTNLSIVGAVLLFAAFLGSDFFLNCCKAALGAFYRTLILPILNLVAELIVLLMQAVGYLIRKLDLKLPFKDGKINLNTEALSPSLQEDAALIDTNETLRNLGITLLVIAAAVVLVLFFRWLSRKRYSNPIVNAFQGEKVDGFRSKTAAEKDPSAVRSIRLQYRKFLKLCANYGVLPERSSTSRDIDARARQYSALQQISGPIRQIYIRARYAGQADSESVQQIKKLCAEGKKNAKQG